MMIETRNDYAVKVGERLRNIRLQKGLSLNNVEQSSNKEFKASVLGAYERGERGLSVPRLQRLARFYSVPVDHLLPRPEGEEDSEGIAPALPGKIRIDLRRLETTQSAEKPILDRYLNMVQMQRGDFNGKVLTIRKDDLKAIASVLDLTSDALMTRLEDLGLKAAVS